MKNLNYYFHFSVAYIKEIEVCNKKKAEFTIASGGYKELDRGVYNSVYLKHFKETNLIN